MLSGSHSYPHYDPVVITKYCVLCIHPKQDALEITAAAARGAATKGVVTAASVPASSALHIILYYI